MHLAENVRDFSQTLPLLTLVTGHEDATITTVNTGCTYCYWTITIDFVAILSLRRSILTKIRAFLLSILIAVPSGLVQES
jgi:hypothetical protein